MQNKQDVTYKREGQKHICVLKYVLCLFVCVGLVLNPLPTLSAFYQDGENDFSSPDVAPALTQNEELNICGPIGLARGPMFLRRLNDQVIASGETVTFRVLKKGFRAVNFNFVVRGLPQGASFQNGVFQWTPAADQTGQHTVTVGVADMMGFDRREKCSVVFDVLDLSDSSDEDVVHSKETQPETDPQKKLVNHAAGVVKNSLQNFVAQKSEKKEFLKKKETCNKKEDKDSDPKHIAEEVTEEKKDIFSSSPSFFASGGSTVFRISDPQTEAPGGTSPSDTGKQQQTPAPQQPAPQAAPPVLVTPDVPTLTDPGKSSFNGSFQLEWSDVGADQYQIERSTNESFIGSDVVSFYANSFLYTFIDSDTPDSGYYYYRVRAWNGDPQGAGLASAYSNSVMIGIDYNTDIDILGFDQHGVFTEVPGISGTYLNDAYVDVSAYSNPTYRLEYSLENQFFVGAWFKNSVPFDISQIKSLNMRVRGDDVNGYPVRMIIELKYESTIQGIVFVSNLSGDYQDLTFSFYTESALIDEVVVYIEDEINEDGEGTVFIDELFFSEQAYTPDLLPDVTETSGEALTDEELLDTVQADSARFFFDEIVGPGFVKDTSETDYSSIAATGFGLSSLAVLAQRAGTSDAWDSVTYADAELRAEETLQALLDIQAQQLTDDDRALYGAGGFFFHFMNADGTRAIESEVSTVDTALLIAGALTAGEYFGGDVKILADQLYANVDWKFFLDETTLNYHMGWRPEESRGFTQPKDGGYISDGTYNSSTDEVLLIALLALGSDVNDQMLRDAYYAYPRTEKTYTAQTGANQGEEFTVVNSYFGSLFTYLYAHCFFDFEFLGNDQPYFASENATHPQSVNWWDNSVAAFKANRQFCIDNAQNYPFSHHESSWGISAVQRPDGRYEGRYGSVPFSNGPGNDGVVALYAPLSSLPFFRESDYEVLANNEGFQSLRYYYNNFHDDIYGPYGFYDSFDNEGNFSDVYLGLDQGPVVMMIENYRSNLIWNVLSLNEKISDALDVVFANGFDWINYEIHDIVTDDIDAELDFGSMAEGAIASAQNYLKIDANFKYQTGRLVVYTQNETNTVPFEYNDDQTNNPAGLVGVVNPKQVAPLSWVVFDEKQTLGYVFVGDETVEAPMQDVLYPTFFDEDMIENRTLLDGVGRLGLFPMSGRTTLSSSVYVYFGADFTGADLEAQDYKTSTITVEIFHE